MPWWLLPDAGPPKTIISRGKASCPKERRPEGFNLLLGRRRAGLSEGAQTGTSLVWGRAKWAMLYALSETAQRGTRLQAVRARFVVDQRWGIGRVGPERRIARIDATPWSEASWKGRTQAASSYVHNSQSTFLFRQDGICRFQRVLS